MNALDLALWCSPSWTGAKSRVSPLYYCQERLLSYDKLYEKDVLIFLSKSDLINKNSLIIVEASLDTDMSYAEELGFEITKEKKYKTNKHVFLKIME